MIRNKFFYSQNQFSTSVGGGYKGVNANLGFSIKTINENIDQKTNLGEEIGRSTIGSPDIPLPIHLDLRLITEALDKVWWRGGEEWSRIKKQKNLMRALKRYPRYVHAKKNTGE